MGKNKAAVVDGLYKPPSANDILTRSGACSLSIDWRAGSSLAQPGLRRSRMLGEHGDFHALKPFAPGDRARSINWRATAATGAQDVLREVRLEEQPIDVFIIVKIGQSMDFGTVRAWKRQVAAEITAAVALSAERSKDRLGFITYSERGVEAHQPARLPGQQVIGVVAAVMEPMDSSTAGGADLAGLSQALSLLPRRRCLVFVISDFFECADESQQDALEAAASQHKVVAVHIEDPRETELPAGFGIISLVAVGGGSERTVLLTSSSRRQFAARASERKQALQALFEQLHVQWTTVCTADPAETHVQNLQAALDGG